MSKKRLLIVGASSLLGKSFLKLFGDNYEVFTCGRSIVSGQFEHFKMDFSKEIDVNILPSNIDIVIYLAQSYKFRDFQNNSDEIFQINTARVLEFLNYAKKARAKRFLYTSTGGVYTTNEVHIEDELIDASKLNGFYAVSKYCAELLVSSYKQFFDVIILRPFFMYGEEQKDDMLIPSLISKVKNKRLVQLQGAEGIKINPIYVDDAAKIIQNIIKTDANGVFNIAGKEIVSISQLCSIIGNCLNIKPLFENLEGSASDIIGSRKKIKSLAGEMENSICNNILELI